MANNYPLVAAERRWREGDYPAHHQWGAVPLRDAGYDVEFLPMSKRFADTRLGDPRAQLAAVASRRSVLLGASPHTLSALVALGGHGRTVGIVHPRASRRRVMLGYDVVVCLSETIRRDVLSMGRDPERTFVAPWGPDLDFVGYARAMTDTATVVSAGKTHRDHDVVRTAFADAIVHDERSRYRDILDDVAACGVVAISMKPGVAGMFGVTELNDALAIGKPVVMSRNPYIDLDVEAEGCGVVVEPGDVDAWSVALRDLLADPDRRAEMGRRGRAVAERGWNHRTFGDAVLRAVGLAEA